MEHSDVLSIAINGIQRELSEAEQEVERLERVLYDLQALDREDQAVRRKDNICRPEGFVAMDNEEATMDKGAIGRPSFMTSGFVAEPLINHDRKQ